jgi:hypothetical protein
MRENSAYCGKGAAACFDRGLKGCGPLGAMVLEVFDLLSYLSLSMTQRPPLNTRLISCQKWPGFYNRNPGLTGLVISTCIVCRKLYISRVLLTGMSGFRAVALRCGTDAMDDI